MPDDVCLHSTNPDVTICTWFLGFPNEPSRGFFDCFTGIPFQTGNIPFGCRNCDMGCGNCKDDLDIAQGFWADADNGDSYVRPARSAASFRNAQNQRQDIRAVFWPTRLAAMFLDEITLEHSACIDNNGPIVCWDTLGHPCQCSELPTSAITPPSRLSGTDWRDVFFYNRTGWPIRPDDMYCRRWDDVPRAHRFTVRAKDGQTQFVAMGPESRCHSNALVMCAAKVASSSCLDCANSRQTNPDGTTTPVSPTYQIQDAEKRQFDVLKIVTNDAFMRHDDGIRNRVLTMITTSEFPDPIPPDPDVPGDPGQPDHTINFAELDHDLLGGGNHFLGDYGRGWTAQTIDLALPVTNLNARLRWGTCDVQADLVITSVDFHVNVVLHRTVRPWLGVNITDKQYVSPYAVVDLQATLAVRAELVGAPCTVGGEPVTLTFEDGRLTPTITPSGNALIYTDNDGNQIHVQETVQWLGRLNQHSFPGIPRIRLDTLSQFRKCTTIRQAIGIFRVPGLMGRFFKKTDRLPLRTVPGPPKPEVPFGDRPPDGGDANIVYDGFIEFEFKDL